MAVCEVVCPCCGATLAVDSETGMVLSHETPKPGKAPADLFEAVEQIKADEKTRDQRFSKQLDQQKRRGAALDQRFEGLLKKAKTDGPAKPGLRDIDLD